MDDPTSMPTLQGWLQQSMARHADQDALECGDVRWTYTQLRQAAERVEAAIVQQADDADVVGVLGYRSAPKYAAVAAAVLAGRAYLPLHATLSAEHTARMLTLSDCKLIVVSEESVSALREVLPLLTSPITCLVTGNDAAALGVEFPTHLFVAVDLSAAASFSARRTPTAQDVAYHLFTIGSIDVGQGVAMKNGVVCDYVQTTQARYGIGPDHRCAQMLDLTFDGSVHDIFVAWTSGACLCVPPQECEVARESSLAIAG